MFKTGFLSFRRTMVKCYKKTMTDVLTFRIYTAPRNDGLAKNVNMGTNSINLKVYFFRMKNKKR